MTEQLTARGAVLWPVGTGDSTTIVVDDELVVQVDLHDLAKADNDDTPETPVVDHLMEALPQRDGRPYLAVFALTHADADHIRGFEDLLSEVTIGEIWATPRLWREYEEAAGEGLCESARAFHEEAERRVAATREAVAAGTSVSSGDRVRIIGYDTDRDLYAYKDLPDEYLTFPGEVITDLDGVDCTGRFEAFVHAPFKDDCAKERNDTSLALQVTLADGPGQGQFLLLGDLAYETVKKIFDYSRPKRPGRVAWDVLLAPHHCSKKVMYVGDELKRDVLDHFEATGNELRWVVSSSNPLRDQDAPGANPPHRVAADRYQEIADDFIITMEHGSAETPAPVVFEVDTTGIQLLDPQTVALAASSVDKAAAARAGRLGKVAAEAERLGRGITRRSHPATSLAATDPVLDAIRDDRGGDQAPAEAVGFGGR